MYKVHRHIHMKHVVIDIYKQNSSDTDLTCDWHKKISMETKITWLRLRM